MKSMSRVHLYPHKEPNGTGYIVAERKGLRDLAKKLLQAADGAVGLETLTLHGSDGHPYNLMIITDVTEEEWQNMPLPKDKNSDPESLEIVKVYNNLKSVTDFNHI
jgi:hypothetical protein